jgi:NAD(P)-dependent dehydrogenase (short-subunit alcohol dehydrogenase family)
MSNSNPAPFAAYTPTYHNDTYPFINPQKLHLKNKNVFITGASKGIGRATALAYAQAGASHIGITARSPPHSVAEECIAAAKKAGHPAPNVHCYAMDVTDRETIERVASEAAKAMGGRIDIVVSNAGYLEEFIPIADSDPDEWWKTWTTNVRGPYLVTRSFLPILLSSPSGDKTIIHISSIGAHGKRPGASAYQTGKFAIARFVEFIMAEYGEKGVLAYCLHPGGVMTELASKMPKHTHGILVDKVEMAGDTIVWLSAERREWLGGRYVSANWDMEELEGRKGEIVEKDLLKFRMAL